MDRSCGRVEGETPCLVVGQKDETDSNCVATSANTASSMLQLNQFRIIIIAVTVYKLLLLGGCRLVDDDACHRRDLFRRSWSGRPDDGGRKEQSGQIEKCQ